MDKLHWPQPLKVKAIGKFHRELLGCSHFVVFVNNIFLCVVGKMDMNLL